MSLPTRAPIREGQEITSSGLDAQYDGFATGSQDIGPANVREFAIDLPNIPDAEGEAGDGVVFRRAASTTIGTGSIDHSSAVSVASYGGATYPAVHPIEDGAGNPTPLSFGLTGWSVTSGDILRVYWDISARPRFTANGGDQSPGVLAPYGVELGVWASASTTTAGDGLFAWLFYLEWDITSNALSNWVPVPGQTDFEDTIVPGVYGGPVAETAATSPIAPWIDYDPDMQRGQLDTLSISLPIRWRGVSGTYFYVPVTNQTVYGIRVVVAGVAHAYTDGTVNYWRWAPSVHDSGATYLQYTCGGLTAILHKGVV